MSPSGVTGGSLSSGEDGEETEDVKPDVKPSFLSNYYLLGDATQPTRFPAPGVGEVEERVPEGWLFSFDQFLAIDAGLDPFADVSVVVDKSWYRSEAFAVASRLWKRADVREVRETSEVVRELSAETNPGKTSTLPSIMVNADTQFDDFPTVNMRSVSLDATTASSARCAQETMDTTSCSPQSPRPSSPMPTSFTGSKTPDLADAEAALPDVKELDNVEKSRASVRREPRSLGNASPVVEREDVKTEESIRVKGSESDAPARGPPQAAVSTSSRPLPAAAGPLDSILDEIDRGFDSSASTGALKRVVEPRLPEVDPRRVDHRLVKSTGSGSSPSTAVKKTKFGGEEGQGIELGTGRDARGAEADVVRVFQSSQLPSCPTGPFFSPVGRDSVPQPLPPAPGSFYGQHVSFGIPRHPVQYSSPNPWFPPCFCPGFPPVPPREVTPYSFGPSAERFSQGYSAPGSHCAGLPPREFILASDLKKLGELKKKQMDEEKREKARQRRMRRQNF